MPMAYGIQLRLYLDLVGLRHGSVRAKTHIYATERKPKQYHVYTKRKRVPLKIDHSVLIVYDKRSCQGVK